MTTYKVKTGHDQALLDLVAISPQPKGGSGIIRYTRRSSSAAGTVHDEGAYVPLEWSGLTAGTAKFIALLTQFGLHAAKTAAVTVLVRDEILGDVRMNGLAVRPLMGESMDWEFRPRDVVIIVRDLEAVSA